MNRSIPTGLRCAVAALCLAVLISGCGPFSGTRQGIPWAQEYNYLKGRRTPPEQIGIITTNLGSYTVTLWPEGIQGPQRVRLPLRLAGGTVTTPVVVNGTKRIPAVLDTGAPFNLASLSLSYNLDLPITRPKTLPQKIYGYGGSSTDCGWTLLNALQFGELSFTNALVCVPLEKFDQVTFFGFLTVNRDEFVILGLSSMAKMSYMVFDFPRGELILDRDALYERTPAREQASAPCQVNPGYTLTTEIMVDGKGPFSCRIDTGKTFKAPALTIPQKVARELGYWREQGGRRSDQVGIGGRFQSQRFKLKSFEIGGQEFANLGADSHEGAGEFILGASFLRQYRMTIDFRRKKLFLEK